MCDICKVNIIPSINGNQYENTIPLQQVNGGSTLAQLYYFRCLNADKLKQAFSKFDLAVETDDDVKAIAAMHDSGKDVSMFKEDFLTIAQNINFTDLERKNAHCKIGFTY